MSTSTQSPALLMGGRKLFSFAAAAKKLKIPGYRNGTYVNASTLYRWHLKGVKAKSGQLVHLEAVQVGCRFLTTVEAVLEFTKKLTEASATPAAVTSPSPPAITTRRKTSTSRELDAAGIK